MAQERLVCSIYSDAIGDEKDAGGGYSVDLLVAKGERRGEKERKEDVHGKVNVCACDPIDGDWMTNDRGRSG